MTTIECTIVTVNGHQLAVPVATDRDNSRIATIAPRVLAKRAANRDRRQAWHDRQSQRNEIRNRIAMTRLFGVVEPEPIGTEMED